MRTKDSPIVFDRPSNAEKFIPPDKITNPTLDPFFNGWMNDGGIVTPSGNKIMTNSILHHTSNYAQLDVSLGVIHTLNKYYFYINYLERTEL